jgi:hypothetical protein
MPQVVVTCTHARADSNWTKLAIAIAPSMSREKGRLIRADVARLAQIDDEEA